MTIEIDFTEEEIKVLTAARKILAQKVANIVETDWCKFQLSKIVLTTYADASGNLQFVTQANGPHFYDLVNNTQRVHPLYYKNFNSLNMIKALDSLDEFVIAWALIVRDNQTCETRYSNVMMTNNKVKAVKFNQYSTICDADFFIITDTIETIQRNWALYRDRTTNASINEFICNTMKKYKIQF